MSNVIVTGLPGNAKIQQLIFQFKAMFKKSGLSQKFWIRELSDIAGCDMKQMLIEFHNKLDAERAIDYLNNYVYKQGSVQYSLVAEMDEERPSGGSRPSPPMYHHRERPRERYVDTSDRIYSRERRRSRSPIFSEASKLDMEIELLRKQRQVIEEERRLLMERKKLELVREYGPSAAKEFEFEVPRERRRPIVRVERPKRPRYQSPPRPRKPQKRVPLKSGGLPLFVLPCKVLLNEMKCSINTPVTKREVGLLLRMLRTTLRKRIAVALEDKNYMSTSEIVTLYRKLYAPSTDVDLVNRLLKNIRDSLLTDPNFKKPVEADGKEEKKKDDTEEKLVDEAKIENPGEVVSSSDVKCDEDKDSKEESKTVVDEENKETKSEPIDLADAVDFDLAMDKDEGKDWIEGDDWLDEVHSNAEDAEEGEDKIVE